jgi:hypothetical protein
MNKHYVVRVVHQRTNNTFRVTDSTAPAMLDLLMKELRRGRIKAFSVEGGK